MHKYKIILDCDPGIDDALALAAIAGAKDRLELLGISAVSGNVGIETVTSNALKLRELYGLDVPVARGAAEPLVKEAFHAPEVHGKSGLGYCTLPDPEKKTVPEPAAVFLKNILTAQPEGEKVTILAVGPMTNIALLLKLWPEVKEHILQIVFMGGSLSGGNVTASAEFNIYADPEAASIVLHSGIPLVMCGLDLTDHCTLKRNQIMKLCQSGNPVAKACGDMVGFTLEQTASKYRGEVSIHDAATVLYLLYPEIFGGKRVVLDVDCSEGLSRGTTQGGFRWWIQDEKDTNVLVLDTVDSEKFQEYLISLIYEAGAERKE